MSSSFLGTRCHIGCPGSAAELAWGLQTHRSQLASLGIDNSFGHTQQTLADLCRNLFGFDRR